MNFKKILCFALALMLALGTCALAEGDDLQAQLDEANAHIAELEAEIEKYRPYYDAQVVAEYGEDGIIWLEDAQKQFDEASAMYAQYGISVGSYAAEIKQSIVEGMVRDAVLDAKAKEMGLAELSEETMAELTEQANTDLETYIGYYTSYFAQDGASEEENREATIQGLAQNGITVDALLEDRISNYVSEQLHDAVTKDVTVSDEEIQAKYQAMVEDDKESYAEDDFAYNSARNDEDTVIAWNPEGYRTVKHVLIKFDDDQAKQYSELQSALTSLNDELSALDNPEPTAEPAEGEEAEATEEPAAPRTREEIQADIGEIGASIEALYAQLMPRAQEVVDAFNGGMDIDSLIAQYGQDDPGMTREPSKSQGYAVAANSTTWDPAFTEGAMSIKEVGQISEPVRGKNGIHIIYYLGDITPGEVPFEEIADGVAAEALNDKISMTYENQTDAWVEEAHPVYHLDRF